MAFAEIILVALMIMLSVLSGRGYTVSRLLQPFCLFLIVFSLGGLLVIGYTVPFTGAIMRYKALYIVLLLLPFAGIFRKNPLTTNE